MSAVAGAIIGGVGSIAGSIIGGNAAKDAANTQANAANAANATQLAMYNNDQANSFNYRHAGNNALGQLNGPNDTGMDPELTRAFTMADFQQDPGYQFQLNQGMGAMQRSAAAKGMLGSMGTMQNLNNYAQGMANTDYQQALNNFKSNQTQRYNMLTGVANMGMGANAQALQSGTNAANNISQNQMSAGAAQSAGIMGGANAINQGISGIGNAYQNYSMMNYLNNPQQPSMFPSAPQYQGTQAGGSMIDYGAIG